jgi:hypothetical protein
VKKWFPYSFFLLAIVLASSGCGPTIRDKAEEYRERYAPIRTALASLNAMLPPEGNLKDWGEMSGLNPKPLYDEKNALSNVEIIMDWQLADPTADTGESGDRYDMLLSGDLWQSLRWTNPKSSIYESSQHDRATPDFIKTLDRGLACRYLVVNRVLSHTAPAAVDPKSFYMGSIALRCFVMDIERARILGSFTYRAANSRRVEYVYNEKADSVRDRQDSWAASDLWTNARKELMRLLKEKTGGDFVLR